MYTVSYMGRGPIGSDELRPPGNFSPVHGFGKLWRTSPEVRLSELG